MDADLERGNEETSTPAVVFVWARLGSIGGTERRASEVIPRLESLGVRSESITLGPNDTPFGVYLRDSGSTLHAAGSLLSLARYLRKQHPQAVVAFGLRASLSVRLAKVLWRLDTVLVDSRNGLELKRGRMTWLIDRVTQGWVSVYMTNSAAAARTLVKRGISEARVRTNVSALGNDWSAEAVVVREPHRVIMVGNSRPEKAHHIGVQAVSMVRQDVHLVVYTNDGSGVRGFWDEHVADDGKSLTVVEGVVVTPDDYARASVLLHPSLSESLPRAVLEAQSQAVRVVATPAGDTASILSANDYCVPVGDVEQMAQALSQALTDSVEQDYVSVKQRTVDDYCADLMSICGITYSGNPLGNNV